MQTKIIAEPLPKQLLVVQPQPPLPPEDQKLMQSQVRNYIARLRAWGDGIVGQIAALKKINDQRSNGEPNVK